mmetsp:Transcript_92572/g.193537  ORF Transcript_92572/g.193537 Transcript_92572/m.193537 type:complete len:86 (-) Transcript_92572:133-390(-)
MKAASWFICWFACLLAKCLAHTLEVSLTMPHAVALALATSTSAQMTSAELSRTARRSLSGGGGGVEWRREFHKIHAIRHCAVTLM